MTVMRIDALCECDGCQKVFWIELDTATDLGDDIYDFESLVHETVRAGNPISYVWGVRGRSTVDRLCPCLVLRPFRLDSSDEEVNLCELIFHSWCWIASLT